MSKITIVHVSDLHWSEKSSDSVEIVANALLEDIRRVKKDKSLTLDMLIFSGDLVLAGEDRNSFTTAFDRFIFPLASAAGIKRSRIYVCPGNHDISRAQVRSISMIETGLADRLKTSDAINAFIKSVGKAGAKRNLL